MTTVEAIYQNGVFRPLGEVTLPEDSHVQIRYDLKPDQNVLGWLDDIREFREQLRAKYGTFPDSTEIIRQDRDRDG